MTRAALALLPALLSCASDPAPPSPLVGDCQPSSNPSVVLGFGPGLVEPLARDAEATQVFGPQGGSHVFVGASMTGFEAIVDLSVEARDAFTGGVLAAVRRPSATARRFPDTPAGACDLRGTLLVLNGLFPGGAGLATVRVSVVDGAGHRASDAQRVWLGRRLPACVPADGVAPSVVPLALVHPTQRRDEALSLRDDDVVRPVSGGDALVGVGTLGFAASAVTLVASLYEVTAAGRRLVREVRAAPATGEIGVVPVLRRGASECVSPATVRLPVDDAVTDRALVLVLRADDGLGHAVTVERALRFSTF